MAVPINISPEEVKNYISGIPGLKLIFSQMEKVEAWNARSRKEYSFISDLQSQLYRMSEDEIQKMAINTDAFLWVLFFLPASLSFCLLDNIKDIAPHFPSILLEEVTTILSDETLSVEDKRHAQVFLDRLVHLNAGTFVANILDEKFTNALKAAIETTTEGGNSVY